MKTCRPEPGSSPRHPASWRRALTSAGPLALLLVAVAVLLAGPGQQARAASGVPGAGRALKTASLPARTLAAQSGGPAAVQPGQTRWAVHPSAKTTLDARNAFTYTGVEPGARISDYVAVINESLHPQKFAVYASDALITPKTGAYDLLAAGQKPTTVGAWIHLAQTSITLKAGARAIIPFTLTVPAREAPGDYSGGIVAQVAVAGAHGVTVDERIGARVYLRVAGTLTPKLSVTRLLTTYHGTANPVSGGSATVTYTIVNTGNVRLGYAQQLKLSGWFGSTTVQLPGLAQLLPGSSFRVSKTIPDVYPAGTLTAHVLLTALPVAGSTTPSAPVADQSASLFEFPWPQLVALLVLALLVLGAWLLVRWRRGRVLALLNAAEDRWQRAEARAAGQPAAGRDAGPAATPEAPG